MKMIDEKKTLGQVYFCGAYPTDAWDEKTLGPVARENMEHMAAGIAAVCRAVMAEQAKASIDDRPDVAKWKTDVYGKLIHEPPKPEAASEAGDWAMEAARQIGESMSRDSAVAKIREAAERHYGEKIMDLQMKLIEANNKLLEKVRTPSQLEHARRLADRLDAIEKERDAARAECERLKQAKVHSYSSNDGPVIACIVSDTKDMQPADPPSPASDATGEDELTKACMSVRDRIHNAGCWSKVFIGQVINEHIRSLFDAVRAERDAAAKAVECHKSYHNTERAIKRAEAAEAERDKLAADRDAWKANYESMVDERDRITAELLEMKFACEWSWSYLTPRTWFSNTADAILAAYRATKGKEPTDAK